MLEKATEEFLENAYWLSDTTYAPLKATLIYLSREIDLSANASMFSEYGRVYRYAQSLRPEARVDVDPLEEILLRNV